MAVAIRNLTSQAIYVPLNSGTNLRLSPGEVSGEFHEVELKNNAKFEKLRLQRAIAVETDDAVPKDAAEAIPASAGDAAPTGVRRQRFAVARAQKDLSQPAKPMAHQWREGQ